LPRFVEHVSFTGDWQRNDLTDEDLRALQSLIMASWNNPRLAPLVQGTGGLRKLRFAPVGRASGKRGAFRVYFAPFPDHGIVLLAALFGKNERSDLTAAERQEIARQLARIRELLDRGLIR
jgi:hypothetical protein